MSFRRSTGMKNAQLASSGVKEIFDGNMLINVYTGTQPSSSDDEASGTLLYTISLGGVAGEGLSWDVPDGGVIDVPDGASWQGQAVAGGTAGWFRVFVDGEDPDVASATATRYDGAVATSGAEMNISNTTIVVGAVQTITGSTYTQN